RSFQPEHDCAVYGGVPEHHHLDAAHRVQDQGLTSVIRETKRTISSNTRSGCDTNIQWSASVSTTTSELGISLLKRDICSCLRVTSIWYNSLTASRIRRSSGLYQGSIIALAEDGIAYSANAGTAIFE